jgi:hypothetical protein
MIWAAQSGLYIAGQAQYAGFGGFIPYDILSGATTPPPSSTSIDERFLGVVQQLGISTVLDASMGIT